MILSYLPTNTKLQYCYVLIKRHDFIVLSPSVQYISVLEITGSHHTLSDQIMETSSQFLTLIGHGDGIADQHILSYLLQGVVSQ